MVAVALAGGAALQNRDVRWNERGHPAVGGVHFRVLGV